MTATTWNLHPYLRNFLFALAAIFVSSFMLTNTAMAKGEPVYYEATLAAPVKDNVTIVKGTIWHCRNNVCKASKSRTKDAYVCAKLARKVGEVTAFEIKGVPFDPAALVSCNGKS